MHRTPARRNPGVWDCAATGFPRAREGPRILDPSIPQCSRLEALGRFGERDHE
jgi:hypothetical protein